MNRIALALCTLVLASQAASATPLDRRLIPADAVGIGHMDVDAFRKSAVMALLPSPKDQADPFERAMVKKLEADCSGVTLWVADTAKDDDARGGVLMLEFAQTASATDFANMLVKQTGAKKVDATRYHGTMKGKTFEAALLGNVVALSHDVASLDKTIGLSQGKGTSLSAKQLPETADHGMFLFVVLGKDLLDDVRQAAGSKLLQTEISALSFSAGEVASEFRAHATAVMATADGAQKVKTVLDGLIALVSLTHDAPPIAAAASYVKVTTSGTTAELVFAMPAAELVKLVQTHHKTK